MSQKGDISTTRCLPFLLVTKMRNEMKKEKIIEELQRYSKPEDELFLWSFPLEKEDLDPDNELSDEKWEEFVDDQIDPFGHHSLDIGKELFRNWINGW
jgi:hypothetical protein